MTRNRSGMMLVMSAVLLVAVIVVGTTNRSPDLRADLAGESVSVPTSEGAGGGTEPTAPTTTSPTATRAAAPTVVPAGPSFPNRITIPSIGVDASVVSVGLEADGSMEIPGVSDAGWYQYGSVPGTTAGSAVIAGHVDFNRRPGVFFDLRRLDVGAELTVTDRAGATYRYVVTERTQVDKQALPAGELFRTEGDPMLTLITCGGSFDTDQGSYADNIVIRAVPA